MHWPVTVKTSIQKRVISSDIRVQFSPSFNLSNISAAWVTVLWGFGDLCLKSNIHHACSEKNRHVCLRAQSIGIV